MQAAVYSRKSRVTGVGESIENQAELCRQYIMAHYGPDVSKALLFFEDEGFSGGNLNRPQFSAMMGQVRKGRIQLIVCYRLDRISRSIGDFAGLIQELDRLGVAFVSIREQFDTHSPIGRAMMYIASVFSQLERETIGERIRDNMHALARDGRWLGGTCPMGYTSRRICYESQGKQHAYSVLEPNLKELEVVGRIYSAYLKGHCLTRLTEELQGWNIKTSAGKAFTRDTLRRILTNPVYAVADRRLWNYFAQKGASMGMPAECFDGVHGAMVYNRTKQQSGRAQKKKPVKDWIVTCGAHPGIIESGSWIRVQESFDARKQKKAL